MRAAERFSEALASADPKYIEEAATYRAAPRRNRHILRIALAVAAAALILAFGTVGVASTIYGMNMTDFLGMLWRRGTGGDMSPGQAAAVESLTQDVGISETAGGVTVTVTSARASGYDLWLVLRVEGVEFESDERYFFADSQIDLVPEPVLEGPGIAGTNVTYQGVDGDDAGLFLLEYTTSAAPETNQELGVALILDNLMRGEYPDEQLMASGPWEFDFELKFTNEDVSITLPDTTVPAYSPDSGEYGEVTLYDIELTSTHITFSYKDQGGLIPATYIYAVLASGEVVSTSSGSGYADDSHVWHFRFPWEYPLDINDVAAIRISYLEIPVN